VFFGELVFESDKQEFGVLEELRVGRLGIC